MAADLCRAAALVQDPISLTSGFAEARRQHPRTLFLDTDPLLVELEQLPFEVISDEIVQRTLSFMRQPADARLTDGIAREICERTASAAVLEPSIDSLGTR